MSGPEVWLSRVGSQCPRCWERWLSPVSPVRRRVAAHVRSVRHARVRCLVVLCYHPLLRCHSTLRWYFFVCQHLSNKVRDGGRDPGVRRTGAGLTPVTGPIFESKIERYFLETFFRERNFCPRTAFSGSNSRSILSNQVIS